MNRTYSAKLSEIQKDWYVIDATDLVLGRMASIVAKMLRGKHKPTFTPHMDCGDNVVIINAEKIHLSGNKTDINKGKRYFRHTGFAGGIKEVTAGKLLAGAHPERVIIKAVERMISRNALGNKQMTHLFVYPGATHPHIGQQPQVVDILSMNKKNNRLV